ncbi:hypothetical protein BURKHO8Y_160022 [Burkholderia sp. 8Y]|nr:hypothetical protein BURKHO8Y_160022 [Burkholderia sp. 8Y]
MAKRLECERACQRRTAGNAGHRLRPRRLIRENTQAAASDIMQ